MSRREGASVILLSGLFLVAIGGCGGPSGPARKELRGAITVNGIKLEKGAISLRPASGHSAPAAVTTVETGLYRFTSENGPLPGPYSVKINIDPESAQGKAILRGATAPAASGTQPLGPKGGTLGPLPRTTTSAEPKLHWELQYTVPADGSLTKDFELNG